jgi:nucleotide-binding universal stress UspA family protein
MTLRGVVLLPGETAMSRQRRSYETGHKPELLFVIDNTEECDRAVYFASRRAARIGGNVVMLRVVETLDQGQQWLGVADIMRAEAHEEASSELAKYAARAKSIGGITPEQALREGDKAEEILKLIDEDEDIFILVLGACASAEGPGPLVTTIGRTAGDYPIPVAIVPGHLSDQEIDALS